MIMFRNGSSEQHVKNETARYKLVFISLILELCVFYSLAELLERMWLSSSLLQF